MAKKLAMIFGVILILFGILGFTPNPLVGIYGYFSSDVIHNIIYIIIGAILWFTAGSMANTSLNVFGAIYILLAIIGFIQTSNKLLGFISNNDPDNWLHLILGIVLLACGMWMKDTMVMGDKMMSGDSMMMNDKM